VRLLILVAFVSLFAGMFLPTAGVALWPEIKSELSSIAGYAWYAYAAVMPVIWWIKREIGAEGGISRESENPVRFWVIFWFLVPVIWVTAVCVNWALRAK
jgi:hypothetical protein